MQAQLQTAAALGADLRLNEKVVSFTQDGQLGHGQDGQADSTAAAELIVAAGAWLPGMLKPDLAANFMVTRQVLYWFRARSEARTRAVFARALPRLHLAASGAAIDLRLSRHRRPGGRREARDRAVRRGDHARAGLPHGRSRRDARDVRDLRGAVLSRPSRRSASGTRSASTPGSMARASSSIAIPTSSASSSPRPARATASSIRPVSASCWPRW